MTENLKTLIDLDNEISELQQEKRNYENKVELGVSLSGWEVSRVNFILYEIDKLQKQVLILKQYENGSID